MAFGKRSGDGAAGSKGSHDRRTEGRDRDGHPSYCDYDSFVDWRARLGRELPFFRRLFEAEGVRTVLDAGCGTAQHAIALAGEGYQVAGFDPSESMLEAAEANVASSDVEVQLFPGAFEDAPRVASQAFGGPADALITLGNGLPHVAGEQGARDAFEAFAEALRPGGVLVLHLLNHERLLSKRIRVVAPKVRETEDGTLVFVRVLDYVDDGIVFDFATLRRAPGALDGDGAHRHDSTGDWGIDAHRSLHAALPARTLVKLLEGAGFEVVSLLGSHDGRALDPLEDESVIVVARRIA